METMEILTRREQFQRMDHDRLVDETLELEDNLDAARGLRYEAERRGRRKAKTMLVFGFGYGLAVAAMITLDPA